MGSSIELHVKIASLAHVKSCVTVGPVSLMANVWPCIVPVDYLSGLVTSHIELVLCCQQDSR